LAHIFTLPFLQQNPKKEGIQTISDNYRLLEVDLRDMPTTEKKLQTFGLDFKKPTLLFAECVLTYINPEVSFFFFLFGFVSLPLPFLTLELFCFAHKLTSEIIKWAASSFHTSHFVTYEQIIPGDVFGTVMKNALRIRGSPLLGIDMYPSTKAQRDRYLQLGYEFCQVVDMNDYWHNMLAQEEKERIERIEPFDEEEEFEIKCNHYFLLRAINDKQYRLQMKQSEWPSRPLSDEMATTTTATATAAAGEEGPTYDWENVPAHGKKGSAERWGHTASLVGDKIIVFGGYGGENRHARQQDCLLLDTVTNEVRRG
jgi:tRNA wybutosine-synthesizing protein 4